MNPDQLRAIAQILTYLNTANSAENEGMLGENNIMATSLTFTYDNGDTATASWDGLTLVLDL